MSGVLLWVPGIPIPQGSKRHVGKGRMIEANPALPAWRAQVTHHARQWTGTYFGAWTPLEGPLEVTLTFHLPRPRSVKRVWPCVRPDLDKLTRAVFDGLTDAGIWADDGQVITLAAGKVYADDEPGVRVKVEAA